MSKRNLSLVVILDVAVFVCTLLLYEEQNILLAIYILANAYFLLTDRSSWRMFCIVLAVALVSEISLVYLGAWIYPGTANSTGVPYWIFLMWTFAAASLFKIGLFLNGKKS
jgi:hypothetical protein